MNSQQERIRRAYDLTVQQYYKGIDPLQSVPVEIKRLPGYDEIINNQTINSNAIDIKEYLKPEVGMRFLDAGCCTNLANYRLDRWPCIYYGADISPALIKAMKAFVRRNRISIGGLYNTDIANMPFNDNFFNIAAVIGVLEYCTLRYSRRAFRELYRVLKPDAKMVFDTPNLMHPYVETMFRLEEYLGRPNIPKERRVLEDLLQPLFKIEHIDDSQVMLKYFVRKVM